MSELQSSLESSEVPSQDTGPEAKRKRVAKAGRNILRAAAAAKKKLEQSNGLSATQKTSARSLVNVFAQTAIENSKVEGVPAETSLEQEIKVQKFNLTIEDLNQVVSIFSESTTGPLRSVESRLSDIERGINDVKAALDDIAQKLSKLSLSQMVGTSTKGLINLGPCTKHHHDPQAAAPGPSSTKPIATQSNFYDDI
ncbi:TPA_asm: phosphoprotein [little skate bornavirus]|uniref:Phosphoprotein n=1 Tax=little skate bornavirus TaxID=3055759 RepID=A0AA48PAW9_9MONO|nr:TPA_asm: phosphoprotein [little skate bornavirus]